MRRIALGLLAATTLGGLLAAAAPASAATPASASEKCHVWEPLPARPGIARDVELSCYGYRSAELIAPPQHGTVTGFEYERYARPTFKLTPDADAPENDALTIRLHDAAGAYDVTFPIHVRPLSDNTPPTCDDQTLAKRTDGQTPPAIWLYFGCIDAERDPFVIRTRAPSGQVTVWGEAARSLPQQLRPSTADGTETFRVWGTDDVGAAGPEAAVDITVGPGVDHEPTCRANEIRMRSGRPRDFWFSCEDADGDDLQITLETPPAHGAITRFEPTRLDTGHVGESTRSVNATYVPDGTATTGDAFTVRATNAHGTATHEIPITIDDVSNTAPSCWSGRQQAVGGAAVRMWIGCDDADGDRLEATILEAPAHGTATIISPDAFRTSDPLLSYTGAADYAGPDTLLLGFDDGHGGTATTRVHLDVARAGTVWIPYAMDPVVPFARPALPTTPKPEAPSAAVEKTLGTKSVVLVKRLGDLRVYASATAMRSGLRNGARALAVTCVAECDVTSAPRLEGVPKRAATLRRQTLRLRGGQVRALRLSLDRVQRAAVRKGRARVTFRLGVARGGAKPKAANVRLKVARR